MLRNEIVDCRLLFSVLCMVGCEGEDRWRGEKLRTIYTTTKLRSLTLYMCVVREEGYLAAVHCLQNATSLLCLQPGGRPI